MGLLILCKNCPILLAKYFRNEYKKANLVGFFTGFVFFKFNKLLI